MLRLVSTVWVYATVICTVVFLVLEVYRRVRRRPVKDDDPTESRTIDLTR